MTNFYHEHILPHFIDRACSLRLLMKLRRQVVPRARGEVLEVGMGSGINLPLYDSEQVSQVFGLEPSAGMRRKAAARVARAAVPLQWLDLPGEQIPLADQSVDTVLLTFTLCTIPDWRLALQQMHRVLRKEGQLLFLEHGESDDATVCRWQQRLTPWWRPLAGGCHLDRPIAHMLAETGFRIDSLARFDLPRTPRAVGHIYLGRASRADAAEGY